MSSSPPRVIDLGQWLLSHERLDLRLDMLVFAHLASF